MSAPGAAFGSGLRLRAAMAAMLIAIAVVALGGCATLQEIAALHSVAFSFDHVGEVRVAGIALGATTRFSSLGIADAARLGAAVASGNVPLELVAHVRAENPAGNSVAARIVTLDWRLFIENHETLAGTIANAVTIAPGHAADLPVAVRFNLVDLATGGARDVYETAAAIAGYGTSPKDLRLELAPTIDTSLGPIRYPTPVVLHRVVGN